jgi:hypothetical protein
MNQSESSPPPRLRREDAFALAALAILVVAFFWRMVFTDHILPRGDVFTYFYPYWEFRSAALRSGQIPLWNPYIFMGAPFLANSQAGVLYPPNWLLSWLDTPTAIKVVIVSHSIWASFGMYIFSRRTFHITILAGFLSAMIFALGGYLTAQVEHVNQLQGLAWLPWLFWLWEEAQRDRRYVLGLALALAMQILAGHTQTAFITGFGLGLWALWHSGTIWHFTRGDARIFSARAIPFAPLGLLAVASLIAVACAAAQLLPTAELAGLSNRSGGLSFLEAVSFSLRPQLIGRALLPQYGATSLLTEYVAYISVSGLLLAIAGAWLYRRNAKVLGLILLAGTGLFLALGAYNPVYWVLVKVVPGFDLFRAPARWLILWAFSASALAGIGLGTLTASPAASSWRPFTIGAGVIVLLVAVSPLAVLGSDAIVAATIPGLIEVFLWLASLLLAATALIYLRRDASRAASIIPSGLATLVAVELFLASQVLPFNHLTIAAAWTSQRPAISTLLAEQDGMVAPTRFLSLSDIRFDPGDLAEINAIYGPRLSLDALYDYIIATKQKEVLTPNLPMAWHIPSMDGFDGGILPTRDYTRFTALFLPDNKVATDGRLREFLHAVPDQHWLNLAGVRYVITDKVYDKWIDGVYYDLQFPAYAGSISGSQTITFESAYSFETTAVGLVGHLEGAAQIPDGTIIGWVTVSPDITGELVRVPLRVGQDFAEGSGSTLSTTLSPIGSFTFDDPALMEYHSIATWSTAHPISGIEINLDEHYAASLVIRGATLIDKRSGAFVPLTLPGIRVIQSGDVKIYELSGSGARAYVVCQPAFAATEDAMWTELTTEDAVVLSTNETDSLTCDADNPGSAQITTYTPERVEIVTDVAGTGAYLILSDTWYPGWSVSVDEVEVELLHANGLFRAVALPSGKHVIIFTYRSKSFEIGLVISALTLIGVINAFGVMNRRH